MDDLPHILDRSYHHQKERGRTISVYPSRSICPCQGLQSDNKWVRTVTVVTHEGTRTPLYHVGRDCRQPISGTSWTENERRTI